MPLDDVLVSLIFPASVSRRESGFFSKSDASSSVFVVQKVFVVSKSKSGGRGFCLPEI